MSRRGVIAGIAAFAVLGAVSAAEGDIGGPPTIDFNRCDRFIRPCGDPIVVGEGRHFNGRIEIIGMSSSIGLCEFFDNLRTQSGFGGCGPSVLPRDGNAISIDSSVLDVSGKRKTTQITGSLIPDVAKLRVRYRRDGDLKQRSGIVAQVDGELLTELEEPEAFGIAEATVRGCIPPKRLRVTALDSAGETLGTDRGRGGVRFCRRFAKTAQSRWTAKGPAFRKAPITYGRSGP